MTWIFGSGIWTGIWLHIRTVGYNRCVTGRRPRDENQAVRFGQRQRIAVVRGTHSWSGRLWRACKGVQALTPPGSWKKVWEEEVLSLSIIGLYTPINHFGRYSTCSHNKDGGRSHIQSRETIGQENHVTCLKLRKFSSCVWSHLQDAYFL